MAAAREINMGIMDVLDNTGACRECGNTLANIRGQFTCTRCGLVDSTEHVLQPTKHLDPKQGPVWLGAMPASSVSRNVRTLSRFTDRLKNKLQWDGGSHDIAWFRALEHACLRLELPDGTKDRVFELFKVECKRLRPVNHVTFLATCLFMHVRAFRSITIPEVCAPFIEKGHRVHQRLILRDMWRHQFNKNVTRAKDHVTPLLTTLESCLKNCGMGGSMIESIIDATKALHPELVKQAFPSTNITHVIAAAVYSASLCIPQKPYYLTQKFVAACFGITPVDMAHIYSRYFKKGTIIMETKTRVEKMESINTSNKATSQQCPTCKQYFANLGVHLYFKHRAILQSAKATDPPVAVVEPSIASTIPCPVATNNKERNMKASPVVKRFYQRYCLDCKQLYTPTGAAQKRCPACRVQYRPVAKSPVVAPASTAPAPAGDAKYLKEDNQPVPAPSNVDYIPRASPCEFCGKIYDLRSMANHVPRCKHNPSVDKYTEFPGMSSYSIFLPEGIVKKMDVLVEKRVFPNRSEGLRFCIMFSLEKMLEYFG